MSFFSRSSIQSFGSKLSQMVMPNMAAFIAWGLITALFIETGWLPNAKLAVIVGPMLTYLLPILIGFQGGKLVYGERGAIVGTIATFGIIVGAEIPMLLGAMIMGPLGGFSIKQIDKLFEGRIKPGFEMLVNNFSAGICGAILAVLALLVAQPAVTLVSNGIGAAAEYINDLGLLPLLAIVIEPGKALFLNNAINHGVLSPLGAQQVAEVGKSVFYLLESNPGPGLGILIAYTFFGKGSAKQSAPGAIIIHFLGGIHEIYFPYILMKPVLILAAIGGGIAGNFTFVLLDAGLSATPSPGSIIALSALAPKGGLLQVWAGVIVATAVSFLIASFLLKMSKDSDIDLEEAEKKVAAAKSSSKGLSQDTKIENVSKIIFACDAGMGSSAMGASILKKLIKDAHIENVSVSNVAIANLPYEPVVIFTQETLVDRAKEKAHPDAQIMVVNNFLDKELYQNFVNNLNK